MLILLFVILILPILGMCTLLVDTGRDLQQINTKWKKNREEIEKILYE